MFRPNILVFVQAFLPHAFIDNLLDHEGIFKTCFYTYKMRRFVGADDRRKKFGFSDIHALDKRFEQGKHLFNWPIVYYI